MNAPGITVNGKIALEGAAEHGRLDMVQLLREAKRQPTVHLSAFLKAGNVSCACPTASGRRRCSNAFQC